MKVLRRWQGEGLGHKLSSKVWHIGMTAVKNVSISMDSMSITR